MRTSDMWHINTTKCDECGVSNTTYLTRGMMDFNESEAYRTKPAYKEPTLLSGGPIKWLSGKLGERIVYACSTECKVKLSDKYIEGAWM